MNRLVSLFTCYSVFAYHLQLTPSADSQQERFYRAGIWAPRPTPNPWRPGLRIYVPRRERVVWLYPQTLGTHFSRLLRHAWATLGLFFSPVTIRSTARFSIRKFHFLDTQCIYVFCVDLRTNSDYFPIQHWLTDFYNRDGVCLLRGTDWVFEYN
jgi:hypothetical protein